MMLLASLINYVHKIHWLLSVSFVSLLFHSLGLFPFVIASFNSHLQKKHLETKFLLSWLWTHSYLAIKQTFLKKYKLSFIMIFIFLVDSVVFWLLQKYLICIVHIGILFGHNKCNHHSFGLYTSLFFQPSDLFIFTSHNKIENRFTLQCLLN